MSQCITIYPEHTKEYKRLKLAADILELATDKSFTVENVAFDAGQNWNWTTIIGKDGMSYQLLYPDDQQKLVEGSKQEFAECIEQLIARIEKRRN